MNKAEIACHIHPENHLFMSVDGKKDFIVFNANLVLFTEDKVDMSKLSLIQLPQSDNLAYCISATWSSNCIFFFIAEPDAILLINVNNPETALHYSKPINDFIEMYLKFDFTELTKKKSPKHHGNPSIK